MVSGAQKRKKKREKEKLAAETERLKLGPTKLWTGLVLHHKDVFVSHVLCGDPSRVGPGGFILGVAWGIILWRGAWRAHARVGPGGMRWGLEISWWGWGMERSFSGGAWRHLTP